MKGLPTLSGPSRGLPGAARRGGTNQDADAQAYITAVETADGQDLEPAVRDAINDFVVGCKADNIWDAIKASCILAGARTLTGALVPLKGTAPTNFNFVDANYNRKTGLVGDGISTYLNSNRANNADPQNNAHISVYGTSWGTTTSVAKFPLGRQIDGFNERGLAVTTSLNSGNLSSRVQSTGGWASYGSPRATGFIGASRSTSSTLTIRNNTSSVSVAQVSAAPSTPSLFVFASSDGFAPNDGGAALGFDDSRLAFYSIGESLDLAQLDTRVTTLINAYGTVIP